MGIEQHEAAVGELAHSVGEGHLLADSVFFAGFSTFFLGGVTPGPLVEGGVTEGTLVRGGALVRPGALEAPFMAGRVPIRA